ncbi:DUF998 domain-containing protein [Rhodococcus oryzae]|uniref:DUF998 domain-containing protein n=1 Tax=Rhodococcus oryzae TaxID=2571143 RepID=UPI003723F90A
MERTRGDGRESLSLCRAHPGAPVGRCGRWTVVRRHVQLEGARRPGYSALRHPVSSLVLGRRGYVQVANFSVAGGMYAAGAAGLPRVQGRIAPARGVPILIGAAAAGLLGSAAFTTDPVGGYPSGAHSVQAERSTAGALHDGAAIPIFVGLPAAAVAQSWRFLRDGRRGWVLYSGASAMSMLVGLGCATAGFEQSRGFVGYGGLFQRVSIVSGFAWLTALFVRELRSTVGPPA